MFEGGTGWRESGDIDPVNGQSPVLLPEVFGETFRPPKKRAETWVQDETKALIAFRKEMDALFNTSKSNKHLWEQISQKMKDRGYDRSPTMCTDKWRNLLKEYKKAKTQDRGSSKIACFKDLEDLLGDRAKLPTPYRSLTKADQSPKGPPSTVNREHRQDNDEHSATLPLSVGGSPPACIPSGAPASWCQRDTGANGVVDRSLSAGKVISVKFGDLARRVRIDGPFESIKESIKTSFGLRTKRPFWLEDDEGVVQTLSRDMPPGQYSLILDPGISLKVLTYDDLNHTTGNIENKILYTEEDFRGLLTRRGWSGLREVEDIREIDSIEDLRTGGVYEGVTANNNGA